MTINDRPIIIGIIIIIITINYNKVSGIYLYIYMLYVLFLLWCWQSKKPCRINGFIIKMLIYFFLFTNFHFEFNESIWFVINSIIFIQNPLKKSNRPKKETTKYETLYDGHLIPSETFSGWMEFEVFLEIICTVGTRRRIQSLKWWQWKWHRK